MRKVFSCLVIVMVSCLNATDDQPQKEVPSNSNEAEKSEGSSGTSQVIEVIAEAAVSNRDYGKDIGDR